MAYTTIDDPSAHFQTVLYTGNGGTKAVTFDGNSDLQPDWIWGSLRDEDGGARFVFDSSRGTTKRLKTDANTEEQTRSGVTAFSSDGFTMGSHSDSNLNNKNVVVWAWKANGGTTTTNDASSTGVGTIDSVYQANTTAGFSIVTYTGTTSAGTIAHGLGAVPRVIIIKNRDDGAENWAVYHAGVASDAETDYLYLDVNNAVADDANLFNDTAPTSTVFSIGTSGVVNQAEAHIAYCFAPIQGYSKYSSYIGNGSTGGPFIYTGFKPAWVLIKATDADDWRLYDSKRSTSSLGGINPINRRLRAHLTNVETTADGSATEMDFLSNGFKINNNSGGNNTTSQKYIYLAIAQSPFVSSGGTPTTGRFEGQ